MKDISEVNFLVWDYGTFLSLAEKLAEKAASVRYYSPHEDEYQNAQRCVIGTGLEKVVRCDDPLDPDVVAEVDCYVFTDIAFSGVQKLLRSMGKAVWGSMGASELELFRTRFLDKIGELGLPVAPSQKIVGLTNLTLHLKEVEDKWVKINRFRDNIETFHHIDYAHSECTLEWLAVEFGGIADKVVFVVQDPIPDAQEVGYDGFCVDGNFPSKSFQGYEKKNQLYLGSWLPKEDMPEEVTTVNNALAPYLKEIGYRNFLASEIRDEFFIDPTPRMAGQTQEHLLETCTNLAEIIWYGSNGILVEPDFKAKFATEATLHYTAGTDHWMVLDVPEEVRPWVKLYGYCMEGGIYHFPPRKNDEVGVVIGNGNTVQEAIDHLKENLALLEKEPVSAAVEGFADLIKEIEKAQSQGVHFSDKPLPAPASVIA
jgi:hypothetical protein